MAISVLGEVCIGIGDEIECRNFSYNNRVPSGVCIYIPGYVYIPFPEIGYVKGMYLIKKVCKTVFTAMFPG